MLKVRLLNDGGYGDMENVKFPVIVEGEIIEDRFCKILGANLIRVGAARGYWDPDYKYNFSLNEHCEVIKDDC